MDKLKILVVDDESRIRKLVRDFLVKKEYEVIEAADGEEALDLFYRDKNIALVILDVMMPKMDGYTATRKIRNINDKTKSNIPIIALTANAFEEDKNKAYEAGMNGFIAKPINIEKLLAALAETLTNI